jgi:hypothetical protein
MGKEEGQREEGRGKSAREEEGRKSGTRRGAKEEEGRTGIRDAGRQDASEIVPMSAHA